MVLVGRQSKLDGLLFTALQKGCFIHREYRPTQHTPPKSDVPSDKSGPSVSRLYIWRALPCCSIPTYLQHIQTFQLSTARLHALSRSIPVPLQPNISTSTMPSSNTNTQARANNAAAQSPAQAVSFNPKRWRQVLVTVKLTFRSEGQRKGGKESREASLE